MNKFLSVMAFLLFATSANAELYVGAGGGLSLDANSAYENYRCPFLDLTCDNEIQNFKGSDLDLDSGAVYGGKVGFFMPFLPWIGFELNYLQRGIEAGQQPFSANGPFDTNLVPSLPFDGQMAVRFSDLRTLGLMIMLRPPETITRNLLFGLEPYVGAGINGSWVTVESIHTFDSGGNPVASHTNGDPDWGLGPLVSVGANVSILPTLKFYTEYKYSQATFRFDEVDDYTTEMDISDHTLMFGLSFNFGL